MADATSRSRTDAPEPTVSLGGFPPAHHVSRDLGLVFRFLSLTEAETTLPVTEHLVDQLGVLLPEVLITVFDEATASAAVFAALPDWMTTLDLSVVLLPLPSSDHLTIRTRLVRSGRRVIVLSSEARSGGRLVGWASIGLARVAQSGAATGAAIDPPDPDERYDLALPGSGFGRRFGDAVGFRPAEDGTAALELAFSPYVANTADTLHGGIGAALAAQSVELRAPGQRVRDAHFRYLSPGTTGPFRTEVQRIGGDANAASWRVDLVDGGDRNRLLLSSSITTTRPS
jgi:acyl-coenzyme A thioesterase PaaI-like protein